MNGLGAIALSICIAALGPVCAEAPLGQTALIESRESLEVRHLKRSWDIARAYSAVDVGYVLQCRDGSTHPMCRLRHKELAKFAELMEAGRGKTGKTQFAAVARAVKLSLAYHRDIGDWWASPLDALAATGGDCEDYVLLARAVLLALGWPADHLAMVAVRSKRDRVGHAILAGHHGEWHIWDPSVDPVRSDAVGKDVLMTSREVLKFYEPLYVLKEHSIRRYVR